MSKELNKSDETATRHPRFWFYDGSVVFCVQSTLFRVHQTVIRAKSEVFDGMFKIPRPGTPMEMTEGCPLVELQDSMEEFEALMTVLYDPMWIRNISPALNERLLFLTRLLRITHKYQYLDIRKQAALLLKEDIPCDISSYHKIQALQHASGHDLLYLLLVARETNLRVFMPSAYLAWATQGPSNITQCMRMMNTTEDIPWNDAAICLSGLLELTNIRLSEVLRNITVFPVAENCARKGNSLECPTVRFKASFLRNFRPYMEWPVNFGDRLCGPCLTNVKRVFDETQLTLWNILPRAFQLESWELLMAEAEDFE